MATVTCRQATFEGVGNIVLKDSAKNVSFVSREILSCVTEDDIF